MKQFILIFLLLIKFLVSGQSIKKQIGTSIVLKNGYVIGDSMITNILTYDIKSRIIQEWRIVRNDKGIISDTNISNFDTMHNLIYYYGGNYHCYYKFDHLGNIIESNILHPKYNGQMIYKSKYNRDGKIIRQSGSNMQGVSSTTDEIRYYYIKDTIFEKHDFLLHKTVKNKFKGITFHETVTKIDTFKNSEAYAQEFDSLGNLLIFSKIKNGSVIKKTTRYYNKGIELYMIEEFFDESYKIITTFQFEYW